MTIENRSEAGRQLSHLLEKYKNKDVVVYALPRGGVILAIEIAKFLNAPLNLLFAHKIGHPHHPEYAIAAVSEDGHMIGSSHELPFVEKAWLEGEKEHQLEEIRRRRKLYLKGKNDIPLKDRIAIIVDDGIATGLTMQVGIMELKDRQPKAIVVAIPVAPRSTANLLKKSVDEVVAIQIPDDYEFLGSVGAYYNEFNQVEDEEVVAILDTYSSEFAKLNNS